MAAPTVVGVSTTATWPGSAGLPFSVNWPGAASGRLVILPIFARAGSTTIPLTSGYSLRSTDNATTTNCTGEIQAKTAGSSESAPSVSSGIADTQPTGAIVIVVDGWSGNLSDVVVTQDVGSNSNPICPAGIAPTDDCLVLRGVFVSDDNAASSALTVVFAPETTLQGSDASMGWWSETANTGAVASAALPLTAGSDSWMSWTIVIPPAAGGMDATATPATIATVAALPAAAASAGATVAPAAIATATTLPAVGATGGGNATAVPAPIATVVGMPAATPSAGATATPAALATATTLPAVAAIGGSVAAPATIATTTALPAAAARAGATVAAAVIATVTALPRAVGSAVGATVKAVMSAAVTATRAAASAVTARHQSASAAEGRNNQSSGVS